MLHSTVVSPSSQLVGFSATLPRQLGDFSSSRQGLCFVYTPTASLSMPTIFSTRYKSIYYNLCGHKKKWMCLPHTRFSRLFFRFLQLESVRVVWSYVSSCRVWTLLDLAHVSNYNLFSIMCKSHDTHCFSISRAGSIASSS